MSKNRFIINNLSCAPCAQKMEERIGDLEEVKSASVNFGNQTLYLDTEVDLDHRLFEKIEEIIKAVEPEASLAEIGRVSQARVEKVQLLIKDLGCASCAQKMEDEINNLEGVESASVSFANQTLYLQTSLPVDERMIGKIEKITKSVEPGTSVVIKENKRRRGEEDFEDEESPKTKLVKLLVPIAFFFLSFTINTEPVRIGILLLAYVLAGHKVVRQALVNIKNRDMMDENFLMTLASLGAIVIGEYAEGVAVMCFYAVGEYLQDLATDRSRDSIADLMDIQAEVAHVIVGGEVVDVHPEDVEVGDLIEVRPGEKVPLDGIVVSGESSLDTVALTGESLPVNVEKDSPVLSGSINMTSSFNIKSTASYEDSTVAKIMTLMEESGAKKAKTEKFITRFSKYYTPVVVGAALALAIIPPLFFGQDLSTWVYRALVFLVASCPCALVVSIPLGFFAGIGRSSKSGILLKGGQALEDSSKLDRLVFDKTGTLTYGDFQVIKLSPRSGISEEILLKTAAIAEAQSTHPIGQSIIDAYGGKDIPRPDFTDNVSGKGIIASLDGHRILAGNSKLMEDYGIKYVEESEPGSVVYIAIDQDYYGSILIADMVKDNAKESIDKLKDLGIEHFTILSGDNQKTVDQVARHLGIEDARGGLLPQDKVTAMEAILEKREEKETVGFTGDGINDAPVLMLSDLGVAMGTKGADAAIEAADVVIMKDDLSKFSELVQVAKKSMSIIYQNIFFALAFKAIVLIAGALGYAPMWLAVLADTGVALICILNAMRILVMKTE